MPTTLTPRSDDPWHAQYANVFRWLNGFHDRPFIRSYPTPLPDVGFWAAPFLVMRGLLGWRDLASGVAQLMTRPYSSDPQVGPAAWLGAAWETSVLGSLGWWAWNNPEYGYKPSAIFEAHDFPAKFGQIADWNGFTGGSDPYHLEGHIWDCPGPKTDRVEAITSEASRQVALLIDFADELGGALGNLSPRIPEARPMWRVQVTARDSGHLGSFRRCTRCHRWFQGPYAPHAWGHTPDE